MATGFGSGSHVDHWTFATADMILVSSTDVPDANARAEAEDENGDIVEATAHGNTAGTLRSVSSTYALKSGTINLNTLELGEVSSGLLVETIAVTTNNKAWPQIVVSGKAGAQDLVGDLGAFQTFTPSSLSIKGQKLAQALGATVVTGNLTGSTYEASIEIAQQNDGDGEPAAHGVSGGIEQITLELSGDTDADFDVTDPDGWTVEQSEGAGDAPQADYPTGTYSAWKVLARDTA